MRPGTSGSAQAWTSFCRGRGGAEGVVLRRDVAEPRTEREHEVGLVERLHLTRRVGEPEIARVERMVVGEEVVTAEAHRDRAMEALGEAEKGGPPALALDSVSGDGERPFGPAEQGRDRRHGLLGRCRLALRQRRRPCRFEPLVEKVFGKRDHDRARHACRRDPERALHRLRDERGIARLGDPFRDAAVHRRVVDLLERPAPEVLALDLADEEEEGRRVLLRRVDGDRGVAGARPPARHDDPRPAREPRVGDRHEAGAGFVPARDEVDPRVLVQRVEKRQVALAGHAEGAVDSAASSASTMYRATEEPHRPRAYIGNSPHPRSSRTRKKGRTARTTLTPAKAITAS